MKTTVYVVDIGPYAPHITKYCYPTIEAWCNRNGWRLQFITERKYPSWDILYEKVQVFDLSRENDDDWSILMDADFLVDPTYDNPLERIHPTQVATKDSYHAHVQLYMDDYFYRDGRDIGVSTCFVAASRLCHDVWTPLEFGPEEANRRILQERKIPDELCISRNIARFSLKYTAINQTGWGPDAKLIPEDYDKLHHLKYWGIKDDERAVQECKEWYRRYWK